MCIRDRDTAVKALFLGLDGSAAVRSFDHAGDAGGGVIGHFFQLAGMSKKGVSGSIINEYALICSGLSSQTLFRVVL